MKTAYTYTLLRYVHDVASGEFANVGVVLLAPEARYAGALCRGTHGRVSRFFPDMERDGFKSLMGYVLKGATRPAEAFATQHNITVVNGQELARRAFVRLSDSEVARLLSSRDHNCPKCESPMVWRTGDFTPFWGCSTYPRCRGVLKHTGAR